MRRRGLSVRVRLELPGPFLRPPFDDDFLVHVELDGVLALSVQIAEEASLPAREREEGHRRRRADVDADVADARLVAELPRRGAARREDACHVAERRRID